MEKTKLASTDNLSGGAGEGPHGQATRRHGDGHPRAAWRTGDGGARVARGREPEVPVLGKPWAREVDLARGVARGQRRWRTPSRRETEWGREGDGGEGSSVINSKFKILVCKLNFSPYSKGQMKNF